MFKTGDVTYQTNHQRLCCVENHRAFKGEFSDLKVSEIQMIGSLPGFEVTYPDSSKHLRSFKPDGTLLIARTNPETQLRERLSKLEAFVKELADDQSDAIWQPEWFQLKARASGLYYNR